MRRPLADKDGEVRELTADDMRLFKPIAEVDPGMVEAMKEFRRKVGRPKALSPKKHIGFRLAAEIVEGIKATGPGYNARVEQALREALELGTLGREAPAKPQPSAKSAKEPAARAASRRKLHQAAKHVVERPKKSSK
jgi:uncharacterized protein (DUF4415 family)